MRFLSTKNLLKSNIYLIFYIDTSKDYGTMYGFKAKNSNLSNGWYRYKFFHYFKFGGTGYVIHFDKSTGRDLASCERSYFLNQFIDVVLGSCVIPLANGETLPSGLKMASETVQGYKKFTDGVLEN